MFEIIAGIIAGLMVKHWSALIIFPCMVGWFQTVSLAFRHRSPRITSTQVSQMQDNGMTDDDIRDAQEGLNALDQMAPSGWNIYPWQFAWSSITAFPFCLIVGGVKLLFF